MKMAPVAGYKDAVNSTDANVQQIWYMGINGSFAIFCLTLKERILTYIDIKNLDKWIVPSTFCRGSCGGVPMMMVTGTSELVKDPPAEKAIVTVCDEFTRLNGFDANGNPNYLTYTDEKGNKKIFKDEAGKTVQKIIRDFDDYLFFLPMLERMYPTGVEVPVYGFYDSGENQKYTERDSSAEFFGARRTFCARELRMQNPDKGFLEKYGGILIVAGFCIVFLVLVYLVASS